VVTSSEHETFANRYEIDDWECSKKWTPEDDALLRTLLGAGTPPLLVGGEVKAFPSRHEGTSSAYWNIVQTHKAAAEGEEVGP
jgi:hypothetical protein